MKIWRFFVYIINGRVIRNKLFTIYPTEFILWDMQLPWVLYFKDVHTPVYLQLQPYPEEFIQKNPGQIKLVTCDIDLFGKPFEYKTIVKYELGFPLLGKKIGLDLIDDEDSNILFIHNKNSNLP